jgi:tRNA A37 methylthiotransferase MiaB
VGSELCIRDRDYGDTESIVRDFQISQLHAFPFSPHVDHYSVPAGSYGKQIPNHTTQKRLKKLLHAGEEVFEDFAQENIGKELHVLIEKTDGIHFSGWSENYLFCSEENFELFSDQKIGKGEVIRGIYTSIIRKNKE